MHSPTVMVYTSLSGSTKNMHIWTKIVIINTQEYPAVFETGYWIFTCIYAHASVSIKMVIQRVPTTISIFCEMEMHQKVCFALFPTCRKISSWIKIGISDCIYKLIA